MYNFSNKGVKSKPKTSRCKKEQLITKTGLAEKDVKSKWVVKPSVSARIKTLIMINIIISGAQGLLMMMELKFLIKKTGLQLFCGLFIYQKFDPINIRDLKHLK